MVGIPDGLGARAVFVICFCYTQFCNDGLECETVGRVLIHLWRVLKAFERRRYCSQLPQ